jgi:penicillin-binding protein 1A
VLDDGLRRGEAYGQYFKEEVRRFLVQRFGWERVYQGGLKVYTTVDLDMQKAARPKSRAASLTSRSGRREKDHRHRSAAGSAGGDGSHTRATCSPWLAVATSSRRRSTGHAGKRQPGSAFKPFVYAAALERGFSPGTLIDRLDEPIQTLQVHGCRKTSIPTVRR